MKAIKDEGWALRPALVASAQGIAVKTALGRVGEADDIGMAIASLVSEESRWITAQNIEISGEYNL